jgi:hypothetical protein
VVGDRERERERVKAFWKEQKKLATYIYIKWMSEEKIQRDKCRDRKRNGCIDR